MKYRGFLDYPTETGFCSQKPGLVSPVLAGQIEFQKSREEVATQLTENT